MPLPINNVDSAFFVHFHFIGVYSSVSDLFVCNDKITCGYINEKAWPSKYLSGGLLSAALVPGLPDHADYR